MSTWIVLADASRVRIFETDNEGAMPREVEDIANPEGRAPERDLGTGPAGSYSGQGGAHNTAEPRTTRHEHVVEEFARDVAARLDEACRQLRFERLWIVAAPHFLGVLRPCLSPQVESVIEREIDRDVSGFDAGALQVYFRKQLGIGVRA